VRSLLSYRDARLLLAGQTLSAFGDFAMWIVMAVWMKTLTGSSARAGLVFFVLALGNLAGPLGGLLADRVRRRPLMIVTDCLLGGSVLALLAVHSRSDAWIIYLVAFVYGVAGSVFFPARSALLRLMLPEELLAEANGALASAQQGIRIIAPLAGAGLYAAFGGGVVAILDAATFVGSALFLSQMRVAEEKPQPGEQHFAAEVSAGFRHVWRTLPLRQLVAGVSVALLVVGFAETLIFFVIARVGQHPSFFGVMATLQGLGAIAGGITAGAVVHRLGEVRASGVGLALFAVCALLLTLPWLPVVLIAFPVAGLGIAWVLVGYATALQTRTPLAIQGRVSAAADLVATLAQTISIAAGAALSTVVDYRALFVVMAAVLGGSALYLATRREPLIRAEVSPLVVD
jgi:MFS family permease